jgi:hypothetical protein
MGKTLSLLYFEQWLLLLISFLTISSLLRFRPPPNAQFLLTGVCSCVLISVLEIASFSKSLPLRREEGKSRYLVKFYEKWQVIAFYLSALVISELCFIVLFSFSLYMM